MTTLFDLPQIIQADGKPAFAVIPYAAYQQLLAAWEELTDIQEFDQAIKEEFTPIALTDRLLAGDSPITVWREYRQLTQAALAQQVGITKPFLSQLENGQRQPSIDTIQKIAKILQVSIEDLLSSNC